jgi:hypothetical protein
MANEPVASFRRNGLEVKVTKSPFVPQDASTWHGAEHRYTFTCEDGRVPQENLTPDEAIRYLAHICNQS